MTSEHASPAGGGGGGENRHIRVLALMEGAYVTGPAKGLLHIAGYGAHYSGPGTILQVRPIIFTRAGFTPEPLIQALEAAGLPFDVIHESKRFDTTVFAQLRELIRKFQPDIVETHMVKSHFMMRFSGAAETTRWLAFHHGYTRVDLKVRIYNEFDRWSLNQADHVVAVCGPFAGQLTSRGMARDRITVQHNSVEPWQAPEEREVNELRASLGLTGSQPVLLAVGRLSEEKGFADLVDAVSILRPKNPNFRLVIVGEGPERKRLEDLIHRHGLSRHVLLPGHTNHIAPYYALASMLVVSSHSEGSPNMLLEGMSAGLPIVSTAAGGIPEMLTHEKDALMVHCKDQLGLSAAIGELLRDPAKAQRLAAAALSSAQTRFSIAAHYHSLVHVYERLMDTVPKGPR